MKIIVPLKRVVAYNMKIRVKLEGSGGELAIDKVSYPLVENAAE